jgi:hypothetical protein
MAVKAYSNLRVGYVCYAALLLMFKEAYELDFCATYLKAIVYLVCSIISVKVLIN